ncbi:hypothetical protein PpBr36_01478 [Pyricularia pennisetigena]|uniref:hypothetical protein n=1 Tax=Pyricularia pennisetigena TaxID=1578925 RepID=UPI00114E500A|nr:hypothetical protein PpBr36_01478 [Pyricularia pennisetigena]TLS29258.1 hypothetical protein PpBr36_01478 [Pyricularia pennisetigena]
MGTRENLAAAIAQESCGLMLCAYISGDEEKFHQVPRMFIVYRLPHCVAVWFGQSGDGSDEAVTALRYLGDQLELGRNGTEPDLPAHQSRTGTYPRLSFRILRLRNERFRSLCGRDGLGGEARQGRSVLSTSMGHTVLAPAAATPGGVACALLGCKSSVLLPPQAEGTSKVVGECYIHELDDSMTTWIRSSSS